MNFGFSTYAPARVLELAMQEAVERAISVMRVRYAEPLALRDLASEARYSPFHFARMFRRQTGVTLGLYLTAVRLFEAKRLLLTTHLNVADIVAQVGYTSVGTFTTKFTQLVGVSPTYYRSPKVRELLAAVSPDFACLPRPEALQAAATCRQAPRGATGDITGRIALPPAAVPATVLIGAFSTVIPQREPAACRVLHRVGSTEFAIPQVPVGRWVVIAMAQPSERLPLSGAMFVAGFGQPPVLVASGRAARVDMTLRSPGPTDPPIAVPLASPRLLGARAAVCGLSAPPRRAEPTRPPTRPAAVR